MMVELASEDGRSVDFGPWMIVVEKIRFVKFYWWSKGSKAGRGMKLSIDD
jgi:hypothetical protein